MLVFPNAKINIGLNVIEKRSDGYHNIESCFCPIPWLDALEVVESKQFQFSSSGIKIPGSGNIVVQAYELLANDFNLPNIAIHLHKNIPIGAGLGGGSADGAFMLKLLNEKFNLGISNAELERYAAKLGSDCPFFIENKVKFVEGTGDVFSDIELDLEGKHVMIVYPDIHIGTQSAYEGLVPARPAIALKGALENNEVADWPTLVKNDFEQTTDPEIMMLKEQLFSHGALYASMTGSGSAVYGIFEDIPEPFDASGQIFTAQL